MIFVASFIIGMAVGWAIRAAACWIEDRLLPAPPLCMPEGWAAGGSEASDV